MKRPRSADPAEAAGALLTLFAPGNYTGDPYSLPGENQLRMMDTVWGRGNPSASEDTFLQSMHLYGMTGVSAGRSLENALSAKHEIFLTKRDIEFLANKIRYADAN